MQKKIKIIITYVSTFIVLFLVIKKILNFVVEYFNFKDISGPRLTIMIYLLPIIITYSLFPKIIKIETSNEDKYILKWKLIKKTFTI